MKRTVGFFPILLLMAGIAAAGYAASVPERAELLVDVDVFDNQTVAETHFNRPFYGPREIDEFFATCRSNGVKRVTWRAMCQIASYPSRLNYNISEVTAIRSNADDCRAEGAFAAKVGVGVRRAPTLPELRHLPFGGLVQRVENGEENTFILSGAVRSKPLPPVSRLRRLSAWLGLTRPLAQGAFLASVDEASGKVLARSEEIVSEAFQTAEVRFSCGKPFYVGIFSRGRPDLHVFVADALALKDGAGNERLTNGGMDESDGLLEPAGWRLSGAAFVTLNGDFRSLSPELKKRQFPNGEGAFKMLHRPYTEELFKKSIESGDPLAVAGRAARRNGIELYVWFDPIDDGRRALPPVQAWSSRFLEEHPQYRAVDREGRTRWGLLCFGYPEVRRYKTAVVKEMLSYEGVTGVALKTHYQHNSIWDGNRHDYSQYLYNDTVLADYHARWDKPQNGAYDTYKLRMLYGGYVLEWLRELRPLFTGSGKRLCMFQAPTSLLDASCGGWVLPPERMIEEKLCDGFLIEPRIHGDSVELIRTSERIRSLIGQCRQNGVQVGFDYWLPGVFGLVKPAEQGETLRRQLLALSQENVDFIGIYEEMCLEKPNLWPAVGDAFRAIQAAPPRKVSDGAFVPRRARNILSVDKGGSAYSLMTNGTVMAATELIDGDESSNSSVLIETWPAQIELVPQHPVQVNTLVLIGGHLGWKNQCAPEDFLVEGLVSGVWRQLAEVKDAATRQRHDNTLPVMCRFEPVVAEKLRVTVTRSSDSGKRFLVLREIEAY